MPDPDDIAVVRRHRNIFENNSESSSGSNTGSIDRENERPSGTRLDTEEGKPCKVLGCRCICEHHHFLYGTEHNPRTPYVDSSRDYCPYEGHGLND